MLVHVTGVTDAYSRDVAILNPPRSLLRPSFSPAASYLVAEELFVSKQQDLILVSDSDVGPIQTHPEDNEIGRWLRVARTWAPGEGRFMRSILRPGMNVIDIGANIGYFTALAARAVGAEGRVLAVEADPETFTLLRINVEMNGFDNVELLPVAAHRRAGLVSGTRDPTNYGGHTAYLASQDWQTTPIQAVRLDDVLAPEVPIHFIKIDIEGMDHAAVEGLEQTIRCWRSTLLVEFNPEKIGWFGDQPEGVLALYRKLGLEISVNGWDALRLRNETAMDIDELICDCLIVSPHMDAEITERTRQIGLINLILRSTPLV
jgi:FkbM family methyltransferase